MIRAGLAELPVRDLARAARFYVETLGLKLVEQAPDRLVVDAGGGFRVALVPTEEPFARARLGLAVASLERAAPLFENRGLALRSQAYAGRAAAAFADPDGNTLFLFEDAS